MRSNAKVGILLDDNIDIHGVNILTLFFREPGKSDHGIVHGFKFLLEGCAGAVGEILSGYDVGFVGLVLPGWAVDGVRFDLFVWEDFGEGVGLSRAKAVGYEWLRIGWFVAVEVFLRVDLAAAAATAEGMLRLEERQKLTAVPVVAGASAARFDFGQALEGLHVLAHAATN